MQNKMLEARSRYLRARRDFERNQLADAEKAKKILDRESEVKTAAHRDTFSCPKCLNSFLSKGGLASHIRSNRCSKDV